jgi:molybdenum cofactor cytidylyltransferase
VAAAPRADPELVGRPRHAGAGVAHVHLRAAPLTANLQAGIVHGRDSSAYAARINAVIPGIVLAAGKSTRMGRSKALLPLEPGETFLTRIIATFSAAGVEEVVVVVGHEAPAIIGAFDRGPAVARFVVNPDYESGQLTSLVAGLRVVDRPGVVAALIALVDAPLFEAATVRAIVDRYRRTGAPIVRPVHGERHGHPVLIARSLFTAFGAADPLQGAKSIVRAHASPAGDVDVDDEGAFADIDTPADYVTRLGRLPDH